MKSPYIRLWVDGVRKLEHRHIWEQANGPIPEGMQIDHINRDPKDNRLENLRVVTQSVNNYNNNAKGFSWDKQKKKYMSKMTVKGRCKFIGYFDNVIDAHAAYLRAKREYLCQTS